MIKRTISAMVGKGSVNHNSRCFIAENVNRERTPQNIEYCNESIKKVYHELFDKAVEDYNSKQKRSDRRIENYYEKISKSKQEKLFHEVIFQIGNLENTAAESTEGKQAMKILDKFIEDFQSRNPYLRVFSAHLHMDEATPHLHIDFVPFMTGSSRGLSTRVSLKQALFAQGFCGGSRQETEWNQWIRAEKEHLARVMERYSLEWEQLGTHNDHLTVLNYKKNQRVKEVTELETKKENLESEITSIGEDLFEVQAKLEHLHEQESLIGLNTDKYDSESEWQLPEPSGLMSAKTYKSKIVEPFIKRLKDVIRSIVAQYLRLKDTVKDLQSELSNANRRVWDLSEAIDRIQNENNKLHNIVIDYRRVRNVLGEEKTDSIIEQSKAVEQAAKQADRRKNYAR
jgi:hypothetical protein